MHCVKKILHAFIIFLTISSITYGQQPAAEVPKANPAGNIIYIKFYGGYGFLTPGSEIISASTSSVGGGTSSAFANSKVGLGAGLHYGGGVGFILNDFLNVGVDAEYLKAENISTQSTFSNSPYFSTESQLLSHSTLSIIPNITFKAFSKPTYYFYTRLGILVDIKTNLELTGDDSTYNASMGNTYVYLTKNGDQKFAYNLNIGAQVAVGVQFRISEILRGFAEIAGNFLPVSPVTLKWTFTTADHENGGAPLTTNYIYNFTYAKSGSAQFQTSTSGNTVTSSETAAKFTQNINYIGLNIGLVLRL
jgi:hypothetical protein